MSRKKSEPRIRDDLKRFEAQLKERGAEILAPTNPYELLRFRTGYGVGIVYRDKAGHRTWSQQALDALDHIERQKGGTLAPVRVKGRGRASGAKVKALMDRDGTCYFFCGEELGQDITIEHLVPIAHGGPNHISNLFLAHSQCNADAGHMSAPEKIKLAIQRRSQ